MTYSLSFRERVISYIKEGDRQTRSRTSLIGGYENGKLIAPVLCNECLA